MYLPQGDWMELASNCALAASITRTGCHYFLKIGRATAGCYVRPCIRTDITDSSDADRGREEVLGGSSTAVSLSRRQGFQVRTHSYRPLREPGILSGSLIFPPHESLVFGHSLQLGDLESYGPIPPDISKSHEQMLSQRGGPFVEPLSFGIPLSQLSIGFATTQPLPTTRPFGNSGHDQGGDGDEDEHGAKPEAQAGQSESLPGSTLEPYGYGQGNQGNWEPAVRMRGIGTVSSGCSSKEVVLRRIRRTHPDEQYPPHWDETETTRDATGPSSAQPTLSIAFPQSPPRAKRAICGLPAGEDQRANVLLEGRDARKPPAAAWPAPAPMELNAGDTGAAFSRN
jgi:hypothetical protein